MKFKVYIFLLLFLNNIINYQKYENEKNKLIQIKKNEEEENKFINPVQGDVIQIEEPSKSHALRNTAIVGGTLLGAGAGLYGYQQLRRNSVKNKNSKKLQEEKEFNDLKENPRKLTFGKKEPEVEIQKKTQLKNEPKEIEMTDVKNFSKNTQNEGQKNLQKNKINNLENKEIEMTDMKKAVSLENSSVSTKNSINDNYEDGIELDNF